MLRSGLFCLGVAALFVCARGPAGEKISASPNPAVQSPASTRRAAPIDFEKDILPVFKNNCLACHNQTSSKADLILETPETILKGGESGPAVVPGKTGESLLFKLASHEEKPYMPPRENKVNARQLTPDELELVRGWIDQGAKGTVRRVAPIEWQPVPEGLSPIYAVALTSDGRLAACSRANQIFIYQISTGRLLTRLIDAQLAHEKIFDAEGVAHRDLVQSLAFAPDGNTLASGAYREVKLWRRGENLARLKLAPGTTNSISCSAVSRDGRWLATGNDAGRLQTWNLETGQRQFDVRAGGLVSVQFSSNATQILTAGTDKSLCIRALTNGTVLAQTNFDSDIAAAVWLSDEKQIAVALGAMVRLSNFFPAAETNFVPRREFKAHEVAVTALAAIPGAAGQLVSGGADGSLKLWDCEKGTVVREMKHGGPISSIAVRPDGKRFASVGSTNGVRLWNAADGTAVAQLKGDRNLQDLLGEKMRQAVFLTNEVTFRKSGLKNSETNQAFVTERTKKASDVLVAADKTFSEKQKPYQEAREAHDRADKTAMELGSKLQKMTNAVEMAEKAAALISTNRAVAVEIKAFGEKLFTETREQLKRAGEKTNATAKTLATTEVDFKKSELEKSKAAHELELSKIAAEKAGHTLAEAKLALTKAEAEQKNEGSQLERARQNALAAEKKPARAVTFSNDNLTLATLAEDNLVHTFNAEDGAPCDVIAIPGDRVDLSQLLGSDRLVAAGADGQMVVWDINPPWKLETRLGTGDDKSVMADRVNAVRFSPDGKWLATGGGEPTRGGEIKIWEAATGKLLYEFKNVHSDAVLALDFSPDGKFLASGAADKFVRVVEIATGKTVKTFEGHTHHVLGVSWKRDGRTLVSAGADNVIKVWDFIGGERRKNIEAFGKEVTAIGFIGYSDLILAAAGDSQVKLLREDGNNVRSFSGATDFIYAASATPDGALVVTGGQDGLLRLWNGTNGESRANLKN